MRELNEILRERGEMQRAAILKACPTYYERKGYINSEERAAIIRALGGICEDDCCEEIEEEE